MRSIWSTPSLNETAPDGSTVELLARTTGASVIRCLLAPGEVTRAVRHASVEEIWYCLRGVGRLWMRFEDGGERVHTLSAGILITLATSTSFQFRNDGDIDLEILITTIPPWPGPDEAMRCNDHWAPSV